MRYLFPVYLPVRALRDTSSLARPDIRNFTLSRQTFATFITSWVLASWDSAPFPRRLPRGVILLRFVLLSVFLFVFFCAFDLAVDLLLVDVIGLGVSD